MRSSARYLAVSTTPEGLIQIEQSVGIGEAERIHLNLADVDQLCRSLLIARNELLAKALEGGNRQTRLLG